MDYLCSQLALCFMVCGCILFVLLVGCPWILYSSLSRIWLCVNGFLVFECMYFTDSMLKIIYSFIDLSIN